MATWVFGYDLEAPLPFLGISIRDIIFGVIILIVGFVLVRAASASIRKLLSRTDLQELQVNFFVRAIRMVLYIFVIGAALGAMGIDVSAALISVSVVIGFVLGFALNETLGNVAAGVMVAFLRPFRKGDYVQLAGVEGTVKAVGINVTELLTLDNHHVLIPNRLVWGGIVINYTRMPVRRTVISLRIGYEENLTKALQVLDRTVRSHPKVLKEPAPAVVLTGLGPHGVEIDVRVWAKTEDLWDMRNELIAMLKEALDREGVSVSYQTLEVHLRER